VSGSSAHELNPQLKGLHSKTERGEDQGGRPLTIGAAEIGGLAQSENAGAMRMRVTPVRKIDRRRKLVILRGYARAPGEDGKLLKAPKTVEGQYSI
jgi:hypothetical protein